MNEAVFTGIVSSTVIMCIIITAVILLQVRNQRRLLKKQAELSAAAIAHQQALLQAVIQSQETERQRIGSNLHDEVGATLSSLRMLIEKNMGDEKSSSFSIQSKTIIDAVIKNVRDISHELSPHISGQHGLHDSLHQLCDTINAAGQLQVSLYLDESTLPANLPADTAMAVYRVMAELLNNTIKHAKAHTTGIRFSRNNNTLAIQYSDDGIGLNNTSPASKGMGLQNIESRLNMIGADWVINKENREGFHFQLSLPLKQLQ